MIKVSVPDIREQDLVRVTEVIKSGQLVQAGEVAEFERLLCEFSGLPEAVAVSSCTAGLHLALVALGLGPGDHVLVPSFTFPATANVVERVGASCIFCEVDPNTYVLTPATVAAAIERNRDKRIKALMVVHEFGQPAAMRELQAMASAEGIAIVEDAACALGTEADGHHVGHYGDMACFSFHPRKAISTGEGGAVLTRRPDLATSLRLLRNHGMQRTPEGQLSFTAAGLNYRLTEFQAALGATQLPRFDAELVIRRRYAALFDSLLRDTPGLRLPRLTEGHSWQSYMVVLPERVDRTLVIQSMLEAGVQTTIGAQALNCLEYFRETYRLDDNSFPVATELFHRGLVLPMYGSLAEKQIRFIADCLIRSLRP